MGSYEAKIYIDNDLKNTITIEDKTKLSEIKQKYIKNIPKYEEYYFISTNDKTIKDDSNFIAKDVVKKDGNGYKIQIKSELVSYVANIYIGGVLKTKTTVTKNTQLTDIREKIEKEKCLKDDENYFFISNKGSVLENDSNLTAEDVWKEEDGKFKIELKNEKKNFKVNLYIDGKFKTYMNITKETELCKIREKCQSIFEKDKIDFNYFFKSTKGEIIKNDSNFIAKDVMKNEGDDSYKIEVQSEEISKILSIYLNEMKKAGIVYKNSMKLKNIRDKVSQEIKENIYFLTPDKAIIEEKNEEDFYISNIIVYDGNNNPSIFLVDKEYSKRHLVIEHLRQLEEKASSGPIDWLKQDEFFKKIEDLTTSVIANSIKEDLVKRYTSNSSENDSQKLTEIDKDFIKKYKILLLKKDDILNSNAAQKNYV